MDVWPEFGANGKQDMAVSQRSVGGYDTNRRKTMGPNPLTVGNGGGGQAAFADPDRRLTGAFVRSAMDPDNSTSEQLVAALFECVAAS